MSITTLIPLFLGTQELLIIALVVLLLFGGKKIPELMRGLGKGVRSFKEGVNEAKEEINRPIDTERDRTERDTTPQGKDRD